MSWEQVGPLVGVIVGALLAAGAQFGIDLLQRRRDRRNERIQAVRDFVMCLTGTRAAADYSHSLAEGIRDVGNSDELMKDRIAAITQSGTTLRELEGRQVYVALVDDRPETSHITSGLVGSMRDYVSGARVRVDDLDAQLAELTRLARR